MLGAVGIYTFIGISIVISAILLYAAKKIK